MVVVFIHVRVQCRFHAGAGWHHAGQGGCGLAIPSAGYGLGYPHLVWGGCGSTAIAAGQKFQPAQCLLYIIVLPF